jgi:hypothetical protein
MSLSKISAAVFNAATDAQQRSTDSIGKFKLDYDELDTSEESKTALKIKTVQIRRFHADIVHSLYTIGHYLNECQEKLNDDELWEIWKETELSDTLSSFSIKSLQNLVNSARDIKDSEDIASVGLYVISKSENPQAAFLRL